MPRLQVRAGGALPLPALVHRDGRVVGHLEERNHALARPTGAAYQTPERAHVGPVVAQSAAPLREQRVVADGLEDVAQVVVHGGEEARRELRVPRSRVEERGRGAAEGEAREQAVELDRARFALRLGFAEREPHRNTHPEPLRQLHALLLVLDEVAVVERLRADEAEGEVAPGVERGGEAREVVARQPLVEPAAAHAVAHVRREALGVERAHLTEGDRAAHHLGVEITEQESGGERAVLRCLLHARARGEDGGGAHFRTRNTVVSRGQRFGGD